MQKEGVHRRGQESQGGGVITFVKRAFGDDSGERDHARAQSGLRASHEARHMVFGQVD